MRYSAANVSTFVLMLMIGWQVVVRLKCDETSNWPLVYWGLLFGYHYTYPDVMNENVLLSAIGVALLLRFEFLGKKPAGVLIAIEGLLLLYFGWVLSQALYY